ncbi:unnamed protein product [Hymenolepis diminuta]|uniref:NADH-ubiquinone oxidoreductase chain 1 n=1 Tax=Hymenolepis diminuta TaxID=6216 RepID=A0A0R3SM92_HYMDI|nr:unnamed protein product [Hymenolepis diminuta]
MLCLTMGGVFKLLTMFFGSLSALCGLLLRLFIIPFFILGERKILAYCQYRKGPNKSPRFIYSEFSFCDIWLLPALLVLHYYVVDEGVKVVVILFWVLCVRLLVLSDLRLLLCALLFFVYCVMGDTYNSVDYAESERELVSGFQTEYSSILFTCLFACEYAIIFIFSWLRSIIMVGGGFWGFICMSIHLLFFIFTVVDSNIFLNCR